MIEQLQKNQKAITLGLLDKIAAPEQLAMEPKTPLMANLDKGFNKNERESLMKQGYAPQSQVMEDHINDEVDLDEYNSEIGERLKELERQKGILMKSKKVNAQNTDRINELSNDIKLLQKYRKRMGILSEGFKTIGQGIYTQKKRNTYKIDPVKDTYGGLVIDLPKLYGQLKLIAYKNGKKVMDKKVDFDTIDLLTKRFNSKKKYCNFARTVFDDLNRLSDITIHRTSKKYTKLGSGLLDRLELLGGSILAGNDGVKQDFSQIAHTLKKLVINNGQLNDLVKEYVIY